MVRNYQCALGADDVWHATLQQASPPLRSSGGSNTLCFVWVEFKRGFEQRRPTCSQCLAVCTRAEASAPVVARKPRALVEPMRKPRSMP